MPDFSVVTTAQVLDEGVKKEITQLFVYMGCPVIMTMVRPEMVKDHTLTFV